MNDRSKPPAKIQYLTPTNALKGIINRPGGVRIKDAVQKAEANLQNHKAAALGAMDADIAHMQSLVLYGDGALINAQQLYHLSNNVYAAAAQYGEIAVSEAAYSLCDLLADQTSVDGSTEAVKVHVASLQLLRTNALMEDGDACAQVLSGLKKVSARFTSGST